MNPTWDQLPEDSLYERDPAEYDPEACGDFIIPEVPGFEAHERDPDYFGPMAWDDDLSF